MSKRPWFQAPAASLAEHGCGWFVATLTSGTTLNATGPQGGYKSLELKYSAKWLSEVMPNWTPTNLMICFEDGDEMHQFLINKLLPQPPIDLQGKIAAQSVCDALKKVWMEQPDLDKYIRRVAVEKGILIGGVPEPDPEHKERAKALKKAAKCYNLESSEESEDSALHSF
eukprot:g6124.t1